MKDLAIELWGKKKNVSEVISILQKIDSEITSGKVYKWLKWNVSAFLDTFLSDGNIAVNRKLMSQEYGIDYKILCRWLNELGYKKFECKKKVDTPEPENNYTRLVDELLKENQTDFAEQAKRIIKKGEYNIEILLNKDGKNQVDPRVSRAIAEELEKTDLDNSTETLGEYEKQTGDENFERVLERQIERDYTEAIKENTKSIKGLIRAIYANFGKGQTELSFDAISERKTT